MGRLNTGSNDKSPTGSSPILLCTYLAELWAEEEVFLMLHTYIPINVWNGYWMIIKLSQASTDLQEAASCHVVRRFSITKRISDFVIKLNMVVWGWNVALILSGIIKKPDQSFIWQINCKLPSGLPIKVLTVFALKSMEALMEELFHCGYFSKENLWTVR